jgi:hypothetical protein
MAPGRCNNQPGRLTVPAQDLVIAGWQITRQLAIDRDRGAVLETNLSGTDAAPLADGDNERLLCGHRPPADCPLDCPDRCRRGGAPFAQSIDV